MATPEPSSSGTESLYEVSWSNPVFSPQLLCAANILEYFCNLSNPFYDRECNNEIIRMQRLSPEQLISMTGIEFYLHHAQEPVLFVIRKQNRLSTAKVTPIAYYYIVNGTVLQAPDLATLVHARMQTVISGLNKTIQTLAPCARYHPPDGSYSWDDPATLMGKTSADCKELENSKPRASTSLSVPQRDPNLATTPYQARRVDCLLAEWANRFPLPALPSSVSGGSTRQTPQSQHAPQASAAQPLSIDHEATVSGRMPQGTPEKKARLA